jgi:hypothetical protein
LCERLAEESAVKVAMLDSGRASGRPSVAMRLDLPDGGPVFAKTSARLFCATDAAAARRGRTRAKSPRSTQRPQPEDRSKWSSSLLGRRHVARLFAALGHGTLAGIWVLFQVFL